MWKENLIAQELQEYFHTSKKIRNLFKKEKKIKKPATMFYSLQLQDQSIFSLRFHGYEAGLYIAKGDGIES